MRVLMLGWEFPPYISGGLGTACYGLTRALSRQHVDVTFVLPKAVGTDYSTHVKLLSPQSPEAAQGRRRPEDVAATFKPELPTGAPESTAKEDPFEHVTFKAVPSRLNSPYPGGHLQPVGDWALRPSGVLHDPARAPEPGAPAGATAPEAAQGQPYTGDLFAEAQRYAGLCVDLARGESFDVIHAHDWLTFPAGMAVAAATGKPLIVHVHSTEFDRSGDQIHQQVYEIERRGVHAAVRVIAVSYLTRSILVNRYGLDPARIEVVYNGIENGKAVDRVARESRIEADDKIVLYLGRITMQKGPEYFVAAAKKVLAVYDKVKFVMAGSGDKVKDVIELAAREGIGHKVLFTGFLRGEDVSRVFELADLYVMPSVSEPFGISALEAINHDVPVIMSKTAGVGEVIKHALKVDFWDIDEMANKIIAVLRHPPLSATLREHADIEVRHLTWDGAATRCRRVYDQALQLMPA